MLKKCLTLMALLTAGSWAIAQPEPEAKDGKQVFQLTLSGATAPKPVSQYYLTPQYVEQRPGDQLSAFMKCFMEQQIFFNAENEKKREEFLKMPLSELPKDVGVNRGMGYMEPRAYSSMFKLLDEAARFNRVEWNDYFNFRENGIYTLLPEVQKMRSLAQVLRLRLRSEISKGEIDRAIITVRSMMGLSKMFETSPCLIGNLVGTAIQVMTFNAVEELIAQPNCPNLYWSFVELPTPVMNYSKGYEGERGIFAAQLEYLLKLQRPITDFELQDSLAFVEDACKESFNNPGSQADKNAQQAKVRYSLFAADLKRVEAARERLVKLGKMKPDAVKQFPPMQVVLTDDLLQYHIWGDEAMKYRNLPYTQAIAGIKKMEADMKAVKSELVLAIALLPAVVKIREAEVRLNQRVAFLKVLEGIRLYLAEHPGELPPNLQALSIHLPLDPVTDKPFEYSLKDGIATLTGGKAAGSNQRIYEIKAAK
jgi:hypothetical protein